MPLSRFLFPKTQKDLAAFWLFLAMIALVYSGLLSFLVGGSRMPFLASLIQDTSFPKRVLVVHVDLGVLTWFAALPASLFHLWLSTREAKIGAWAPFVPACAVTGALLISSGIFMKNCEPFMVNYIPLMNHPAYQAGLLLFFSSVGMSLLEPALFKKLSANSTEKISFVREVEIPSHVSRALNSSRNGIRIGVCYYFLALMNFAFAYNKLDPQSFATASQYYEVLMWGAGHTLQMVNSVFAVVAWTLLAAYLLKDETLSKKFLDVIYAWLALPALLILGLGFYDPSSEYYRSTFTQIMRWGIFPPTLIFLIALIGQVAKSRLEKPFSNAVFINLLFSILLIVIGYIFGAFIRGSDLRVPGHYHASIGAVTLAYMALSLLFIEQKQRGLYWVGLIYGTGQIIFSSGMFVAGSFGMARKIYGVEQSITHPGQSIGFAIMAVGGAFAFAGGGTFACLAISRALKSFSGRPNTSRLPSHASYSCLLEKPRK
ncbi:MAG: hypothetical protein AB7H48_02430 [Parachlamydiales bacterium]